MFDDFSIIYCISIFISLLDFIDVFYQEYKMQSIIYNIYVNAKNAKQNRLKISFLFV